MRALALLASLALLALAGCVSPDGAAVEPAGIAPAETTGAAEVLVTTQDGMAALLVHPPGSPVQPTSRTGNFEFRVPETATTLIVAVFAQDGNLGVAARSPGEDVSRSEVPEGMGGVRSASMTQVRIDAPEPGGWVAWPYAEGFRAAATYTLVATVFFEAPPEDYVTPQPA